ncbi:Hypothetical protein POVR1_LOCUS588 [uncultured virus]|nr:Hypothetical protein POVR1_LOCUS588 [uncultured virus]
MEKDTLKEIEIPVESVMIDTWQPSVNQIITNTLVIVSGGVHRVMPGINHVVINAHEKVILVLPELKVNMISTDGGDYIYQSILITVVRLLGDHQIKTSNTDIKINNHLTSIYLDDVTAKYHLMAMADGWIAYL